MAEYLGSESDLPKNELIIPALTNSIVETNQNIDENSDKFSELTPLVFYHILSFLGVNDLARLCVVSARFQERCMSSPNILFDVDLDDESCCKSKCRGLRNLLDKLLDVQAAESRMDLFRLHWHCFECKDFSPSSVFHRWVKRAVVCNAPEIDIGFFPGQVEFVLPECLGRASTIILRLNLQGGLLNCQRKDDFAFINVLSLSLIRVRSGCHLGQWISSHFASLKILKLEKIFFAEDLSITSPSLECLTISRCLIGLAPGVYTCHIECISLETLILHYSRFKSVKLSITCPYLKDMQIIKCCFVTTVYCEILAEALCTLSIDMTFFGPWARDFEIHPLSLPSLERVALKLGSNDESDEWRVRSDIRICFFEFLPRLKYPYVLEIDIGTVKILDLKEEAADVLCQSDVIMQCVVGSLKSFIGGDIRSTIEINWLKRPITMARDGSLTCLCKPCILSTVKR